MASGKRKPPKHSETPKEMSFAIHPSRREKKRNRVPFLKGVPLRNKKSPTRRWAKTARHQRGQKGRPEVETGSLRLFSRDPEPFKPEIDDLANAKLPELSRILPTSRGGGWGELGPPNSRHLAFDIETHRED